MSVDRAEKNCVMCGSEATDRVCWCHGPAPDNEPCDCSAPVMRAWFTPVESIGAGDA